MSIAPMMLCKKHRIPECPRCKEFARIAKLKRMVSDCEPYLKECETPVQRIQRERRDTDAALTLLIREKRKAELMAKALEQIAQHFSSDWPERCQTNVLAARHALNCVKDSEFFSAEFQRSSRGNL